MCKILMTFYFKKFFLINFYFTYKKQKKTEKAKKRNEKQMTRCDSENTLE